MNLFITYTIFTISRINKVNVTKLKAFDFTSAFTDRLTTYFSVIVFEKL